LDLAFSPDSQLVAITDTHGNLYVWERATRKELFHVAAHPVLPNAGPGVSWVTTPAFNHDGSVVATACGDDPFIKVWEVPSGKLLKSLGPGEGFSDLAYSPNGTWVAATGKHLFEREPDLSVRVWDAKTGQTRHVLHGHVRAVTCLAFSPDERLLATGSQDNTVTLWDVATGHEVGTYRGHLSGIIAVAFSADGKQVTSLGGDGVVKTWNAARGPEVLKLRCRGAYHAAFSPDGRYLAAQAVHATKKKGMVIIWDTATGEEVNCLPRGNESVNQLAYSPDGRFIATASKDRNLGLVRLWDVAAGKLDRRFPDENQGLIGPCYTVAYSPDGKLLAAGGLERIVHVWDTATGAEKFRLEGHARSLTGLAFSRDSRRLASSTGVQQWGPDLFGQAPNPLNLQRDPNDARDLRVWDTETGKELLCLPLPNRAEGEALGPDGDLVAVTMFDKTVRLYAVPTGKELLVLRGHTHAPCAVAFSPDGKRIVTGGGEDKTVKLWDVKTGEEILTFSNVSNTVTGVAFSPDGNKIVAISNVDDVVKVWDATPLPR
jgi:WD40 repeat protein